MDALDVSDGGSEAEEGHRVVLIRTNAGSCVGLCTVSSSTYNKYSLWPFNFHVDMFFCI